METSFGSVIATVERVYRSRLIELQRMEGEYLRIPTHVLHERIVETRGFLKGLRKIYDVVQCERVENPLLIE